MNGRGIVGVLRQHVPAALAARELPRVPWLLLCSWLYAQGAQLPNLNQQVLLYTEHHDRALLPLGEWVPPPRRKPLRQRRNG